MKHARPMSLVERDKLLHEHFKAACEELRRCVNDLCDEVIPVMEGDSESCDFFEPGEVNFMSPMYELDDTDLGECLISAGEALKEMQTVLHELHATADEVKELRNIKVEK